MIGKKTSLKSRALAYGLTRQYILAMDISSYMHWIWLGVFALSVAVEAATMGLTTIWCAISALIMIAVSLTGIPVGWQVLIFCVLTIVLFFTTRPFFMRKMNARKTRLNVNSMPGQEVMVTKAASKFEKGEARSTNGVIWAIASKKGEDIPAGAVCVVREVEGNTLFVERKGE